MKNIVVLGISLLSLVGCTSQPVAKLDTNQSTIITPLVLPNSAAAEKNVPLTSTAISAGANTSPPTTINQERSKQQPLQIVLAFDKTGSKTANKIPEITINQMRTIALGILQRGGDLRTTSICTDSDKAMPRLYVEPAKQSPVIPLQAETGESNVFAKAKQQEEQAIKLAGYQQQKHLYDQQQQSKAKADHSNSKFRF